MQDIATVFAVIPVYNRLALTRRCINLLSAQDYPRIEILVADGGSSDGTPDAICREFPDVKVLTSEKELWWTGAMAMGIDYALRQSKNPSDFLLMMNNDTEFPSDFVSVLVRVSREERAAVGALTVDIRDPGRILDAGEFIDWENYAFPVKTEVGPDERFFDEVDVLPGRGTLVPLEMVRCAGNVDAKRFPHYIADYEFFARLKRFGFRLGVTYETFVKSDPEVTGLAARAGQKHGLGHSLRLLLSRRSMNNFLDHYRFISAAAPAHLKIEVRRRYVLGIVSRGLAKLGLAPLLVLARETVDALAWFVRPPLSFSYEQAMEFGVDADGFVEKGVIAPYRGRDGSRHYFRIRRSRLPKESKGLSRLLDYARSNRQRAPRSVICLRLAYRVYCRVLPSYYATDEDCSLFGLSPSQLIESGSARPAGVTGFYVLSTRLSRTHGYGSVVAALYNHVRGRRQTLRRLRVQHPEAR